MEEKTKPNKLPKRPALRGKKKKMFEELKERLGVVSTACKQVGISRQTHYFWLKEDPVYKAWIDEVPELCLDFAENALFRQIEAGEIPSTIFYLKTKGKKRGYVEKQEIDINGAIATLTKEERAAEIKRLLEK